MKTPCVKICKISPITKLCDGCFRSIDEISRWSELTDSEKDDIMKVIEKYRKPI